MNKLALEGIDGSGKSTVAELLTTALEREDIQTRTVALYRIANKQLGTDVYNLWNTSEGEAAVRYIADLEEIITDSARDDRVDLLIFDRHWMSGLSFTANTSSETAWKTDGIQPIPTAYLRISPAVSLARKTEDLDEAWMNTEDLENDLSVYEAALRREPQSILGVYRSDDTSPEDIATNIMWDLRIRR